MTNPYKLLTRLLPVALIALLAVACSDAKKLSDGMKSARGKAETINCHNKLKILFLDQRMWQGDNNKSPSSKVTLANIKSQMNSMGMGKKFESLTTCPSGGQYTLTIVSEQPTCSVHGTFASSK